MGSKKDYWHYFGAREQGPFSAMASRRDRLLRGVNAWFVRRGIVAKQITLLSFLVQLLFFPLFFYLRWWPAALGALVVHILLDGLDGPLARYTHGPTQSGAVADMLNDISGMAIVGLAIIFCGEESNPGLVATYIVVYLYLMIFMVLLNIVGRPFPLVLRTKYFFFGFIFLKYWLHVDYLQLFLEISIVYMAAHSAFAVIRLLRTIDATDVRSRSLGEPPTPADHSQGVLHDENG